MADNSKSQNMNNEDMDPMSGGTSTPTSKQDLGDLGEKGGRATTQGNEDTGRTSNSGNDSSDLLEEEDI